MLFAPARLNDLDIIGFRAFRALHIPRLGLVNLIVGKNNTGKTTVLEAMRLYHADNNPRQFAEVLASRDEYSFLRRKDTEQSREQALAFESLFYGRLPLETRPQFSIGPTNKAGRLSIRFVLLRRILDDTNSSVRYVPLEDIANDSSLDPDIFGGFETHFGDNRQVIPLDRFERWRRARESLSLRTNAVYLSPSGMSLSEIGQVWDTVALTDDEEWVVSALRTVLPTLERIVLVQSPEDRTGRILLAKLGTFRDPVPFRSLGDGAIHLLGVALALIRARGGVLLADEIENGIHYSVQSDLWRLIHEQARKWGIQVFATTHSWDCVEGFGAASADDPSESALIRLEDTPNGVRAVEFSEDELAIARKERIEIR